MQTELPTNNAVYKILIVDDEKANLRLLERLFRRQYQIISASSGKEALELLVQHEIAVIISDQRMPEMTGIEFLKRAAAMRQHTVRIILTGYTEVEALVEAINSGVVYKYVTKPWINEDLQQTVSRALEHHETVKRQYELTVQNSRLTAQLKTARESFVRFLIDAIEVKKDRAAGFSQRISLYAAAVGRRLRLSPEEIEELSLAAALYDSGQIGIAPDILHKNTVLTEHERRLLEFHAESGACVLTNVLQAEKIASVVRHRYERWDGNGYPENLRGEQIPLYSRIIAVADTYDKMTSGNSPQRPFTHNEAVERLRADADTRFDPEVVAAFDELSAIGQIRRAMSSGLTGMRLIQAQFSRDCNHLSTADLLQTFKTEPMLAMEVLKLTNASFPDRPTAQLFAAMFYLGAPRLRTLLEQHGLPCTDANAEKRAARSLRCAIAAQMLAAHTNIMFPDEAYTLGLLYDVGEFLLVHLFPAEMEKIEELEGESRDRRQIEIFGISAVQISRWMLEECGLPEKLTAVLQNYTNARNISNPVALLLYAARLIASAEEENKAHIADIFSPDCLRILRLSRTDLNQIYERADAICAERTETIQQHYESEPELEPELAAVM